MSLNILEAYNVSKTYGGVTAVDSFNFSVKKGEIHCLVGENGSGKSTFMKIIAGVVKPDNNSKTKIILNGNVYTELIPRYSMAEGVEVIYQELSLFDNLSVAENITMNKFVGDKIKIISWKEMKRIAKLAIERIKADLDVNEIVGNYSPAKQQLVAICRAISTELKLLIMDEPTSSLGKSDVDNLLSAISILKDYGVSILFIGHRLQEVLKIADRVTVMRDGKKITTISNIKELKIKQLSKLMTGRELEYIRYKKKRIKKKSLLKLINLTRKGGYDNINLELFSGDILGIIGLVGSGRTELISSIFGVNKPDSGRIILEGKPVKINNTTKAIKYGIGLVPENRLEQGLFIDKTIANNICVANIGNFKNKFGLLDNKKISISSNLWVNKLSIKTPSVDLVVKQLSGGNQQRVVLAKWLETNPKLILLDCPTHGIDVGAKVEIIRLIQGLAEKGIGIIMITDEILEVIQYTTKIIVMRLGKIIGRFNSESVNEEMITGLLK
jgi:simple sugar transport system ATP-binding protein